MCFLIIFFFNLYSLIFLLSHYRYFLISSKFGIWDKTLDKRGSRKSWTSWYNSDGSVMALSPHIPQKFSDPDSWTEQMCIFASWSFPPFLSLYIPHLLYSLGFSPFRKTISINTWKDLMLAGQPGPWNTLTDSFPQWVLPLQMHLFLFCFHPLLNLSVF